jgi:hypothetical protein
VWAPGANAHDDGRRVFADTDEVTVDPPPPPVRSGRDPPARIIENYEGVSTARPLVAGSEPLVSGIDGSTTPRYDRYVLTIVVPERFG